MNTSKSLKDIVDEIVHIGYARGYDQLAQQANLPPYNHRQPWTEAEAKQAIVEAVEGLAPKVRADFQPNPHDNSYDVGYNKGVADFLQAIKEWQDGRPRE